MRTLDLPAVKKLRDGDLLTLKGHTYEFLESDPHGLRCLKLPGRELVTLDSHSRFTRQVGAPLRVIGTAEARRLGLLPEGGDTAVLDLEEHRKSRGK